jgi:hypothetical protein
MDRVIDKESGLTGQTHRADKSNINDVLVTKAGRAEIDSVLSGNDEDLANGRCGQKGHLDRIDQYTLAASCLVAHSRANIGAKHPGALGANRNHR